MNFRNLLFSVAFLMALSPSASADVPVGLWQAKPDRRGYDTPWTDLGRRMLLDMQVQSDGSYAGKVWEPVGNRMLTARMRVRGNMMELNTCAEVACAEVVWTRLR